MRGSKIAALAAAGVIALFAATGAGASVFDFSYTFSGGGTVTGSFDGTGNLTTGVTDITNITATLSGVTPAGALSGPLYAFSYTSPPPAPNCPTCFAPGGAIVTSNPLTNNFVFANSTTSTSLAGYTNYFYMIPWSNPGQTEAVQFYSQGADFTTGNNNSSLGPGGPYLGMYNGDLVTANWSVTEVPEPAAWALMLVGVAGLGAMLRRRRLAIA